MWATTRHGFHDYGEQLRTGLLKLYGSVPTKFDAGKLDGLADLGNIDDVQATWDAYRSAEPSGLPHADICRAYMSALLKAERPEDAMRVFEDVRRRMGEVSNIAPEASLLRLYHVALEVLLRQSEIAEAQSILVDMQNRGPHPSVVTYNILLRHLAVLKQAKQLESIFTRMRTDGLHPNKESYSWLIVGLRTVHSDATRRVLEMMKADGALEANGATFGWMIRFLTGKKFVQNEEAFLAAVDILNFLNGHMSGPLRPTEIGIVRVLCAIERRVWADPAFESLLREAIASVARRHGRDILGRSQNAYEIITACLQNPTPAATQRAWQYYREHAGPVPKGHQYPLHIPMEDTWIELLDGFRKRGEWGLADSLVKEIEAYEQFTTFTTQGLLWSRKLVRQRSSADKSFEKYSNTM
ncbi:hypothetical protein PHLGIDRAFT_110955 [Phlebiopsis gigantea 11061_1 CR5-6]|uniref:Pentacotripeptide-repeat region of PRORP domain-containing protein n=1 Tax=Phlebiopsis gigantea (strain 11061_1 CR5-6) TaxID=745531 RepID=A0A0C3PDK0_PHLG1|nr:hypothetical protein PHLGIDRAFT_110955 [Phlebiopsis gigantea 11061_1 CR5-6]